MFFITAPFSFLSIVPYQQKEKKNLKSNRDSSNIHL